MDLTQIALGVVLLAVSLLTVAGRPILESHTLGYVLTGAALVIAAGALVVGMSTETGATR